MRYLASLLAVGCALVALPVDAAQDVTNTVHNLSSGGPGTFKSLTVDEVCVFCHTPHNAAPSVPLWNHQLSTGQTYIEYGSSTLHAVPGNPPTGESRLCLACHDGTVALGAIGNLPAGQSNDLTATFLTGRANLSTDLSDDHPISFVYDGALQAANGELANPAATGLPLDNGELQCTSCHDPHEKDIVPFLHKTTLNGALCTSCHTRGGAAWTWSGSSHATSIKTPTLGNPWAERKAAWQGTNVAQNACFNCHQPHNAVTPPRLIKNIEENTCYLCHDGTVAATDIQAENLKFYRHPVDITPNPGHDAASVENPLIMPLHVECMDCHNPHAVADAPPMISFNPASPAAPHTVAPAANARIAGVPGLDLNGSPKPEVDFQYELCFKCHGVPGSSACGSSRCQTASSRQMVRLDGVYNIRDKVNSGTPGIVSYHPIESNNPANNTEVPSLRTDIPLNKVSSLIYCTDCHSGDQSAAAGGVGPNGPHGSANEFILSNRYNTIPELSYVNNNYQLCFKCHSEAQLIVNTASGFSHDRHVSGRNKSCINCHDPHGSTAFPHLLNFLISSDGAAYEILDTDGGGVRWVDNGLYSGSCYLNCHGTRHAPRSY